MLTNHLLNINLTKALIWKPLGNYLNIDLPFFPFSQQRERITVKEALAHWSFQAHKHKQLQGLVGQL